jgi:rhodanese-related sulfurtransferase
VSARIDDLVEGARQRIGRIGPEEIEAVVRSGGLVVDIRPAAQRADEGELPGAVVLERNVLEWRLDPTSPHRLPQVHDHDVPIVIVCSEGYASSLAAASLADLGLTRPLDLKGGYRAWRAWSAARSGAGA